MRKLPALVQVRAGLADMAGSFWSTDQMCLSMQSFQNPIKRIDAMEHEHGQGCGQQQRKQLASHVASTSEIEKT